MPAIEGLLTARLFMAPQRVDDDLYFISDLNGRLSLYRMPLSGGIPQPLLPPQLALQHPHHIGGRLFVVLPALQKILLMLDHDGDELYQPMVIPIDGGVPAPIFADTLGGQQINCLAPDLERNIVYFSAASQTEPLNTLFQAQLDSNTLIELAQGVDGPFFGGHNADHTLVGLIDGYDIGDNVLRLVRLEANQPAPPQLVYGVPIEQRTPENAPAPNELDELFFIDNDQAALVSSIIYKDTRAPTRLLLDGSQTTEPVTVQGTVHTGTGEMDRLQATRSGLFLVGYNIDGASWVYECRYNDAARQLTVEHVLCGQAPLSAGVLESLHYDPASDSYTLAFSTACTPIQLYTIAGPQRDQVTRHTDERLLGVAADTLAAGEDASFTSYDGLRISARLYLPTGPDAAAEPYPLIYYIHGGPQSQERPDFAWFSMPLIQWFTLNGFAVFVPNVRGSSGYGFSYMNQVSHDWGGADRLDHVHAMTEVLPRDPRLDTQRTGVMGRSYGGFMTLTLAARHPELWAAAVDMFGPYDLFSFSERIPETWKAYMARQVGDPVTEADFLRERSPRTYIANLRCPLLVIQGANDPRVIRQESEDVVAELRAHGGSVELLVFEDEGHDVLKFPNKVRCYSTITDFFKQQLQG